MSTEEKSPEQKITEFEVFSAPFDGILEPIACVTRDAAERVCQTLRDISGRHFGTSCAWEIREVEKGKRPLPAKAEVCTSVTVDEVRKLMAKHGQDLMVVFTWSASTGIVSVATAGGCAQHSEWAYSLSQCMLEAAGLNPEDMRMVEDRRVEHTEAETSVYEDKNRGQTP